MCYYFVKPEIEIGYQKGSKKQEEYRGIEFTTVDTYLNIASKILLPPISPTPPRIIYYYSCR